MEVETTIESLPNEILLSILPYLSTSHLLSLLPVSRRFYWAAFALLHDRLLRAAATPEHYLTLECYRPDERLTAPMFYCDYLATDPLSTRDSDTVAASLSALNGLYSHFKPTRESPRRRSVDGSRASSGPDAALGSGNVHLDEHAPFAQLCTAANLVKLGPRRGLFLSHVNVSEGVIRVWRNWLSSRASSSSASPPPSSTIGDGSGAEEMLWTDADRTVGIRVGLVETADADGHPQHAPPVLVAAGEEEDLPVSYRLEYSEVVVRSSRLLRMLERSETQEANDTGKAIVLAI